MSYETHDEDGFEQVIMSMPMLHFFFFEPQRVDVMGLLFLLSTFVAWENSVPILTAKGMRGTNNFSSHQKHILCKIYQNEKTIVFLGNEGNLHK